MPIPKPKPTEDEQDYMGRCMSFLKDEGKYPDNKQRVAICLSTFRRKNEDIVYRISSLIGDETTTGDVAVNTSGTLGVAGRTQYKCPKGQTWSKKLGRCTGE